MKKENTTRKLASEANYLHLLMDLYNRQRGIGSLTKVLTKHKVSKTAGVILKKLNLIENKDGYYKWIGSKPDSLMAGRILFEVNNYIKQWLTDSPKVNYKNKVKKQSPELSLMKKVWKREGKISSQKPSKRKRNKLKGERSHISIVTSARTKAFNEKNIEYHVYKSCNNVIDVGALITEKQNLLQRINKIDALLEMAKDFVK